MEKKSNNNLHLNEEFREYFEHLPIGAYRTSSDGRFLIANQALVKIFGCNSLEELLQTDANEFYIDSHTRQNTIEQLKHAGGILILEIIIRRKDGKIIQVRDYGRGTFNDDGEVEYIDGIIEDVTDKLKTEEALYWQAGVNSAFAELSKAIIAIDSIDEVSKLIFEHSKRLTGSKIGFIGFNINLPYQNQELEEVILQESTHIDLNKLYNDWEKIETNTDSFDIWKPICKHDNNIIINSLDPSLTRGLTDVEFYWLKKFGKSSQIQRLISVPVISGNVIAGQIAMANAKRIYTEDDLEVLERMASLLSVVLQKFRAENKIRSALSKEQELNYLKSSFIDLISHEYRTPLTSIGLSTELLKDYTNKLTDEDKYKQYEKIQDSLKAMNSLLDDIISYSSFDIGKVIFSPSKLDLGLLCVDVVNELKFLTKDKCFIDLTVNNENEDVFVDEKIIRQILTVLLLNAVKYSKPALHVEFYVNIQKEFIEFIVKDYGIGIPKEDYEKIFLPFHRGKNITNESGTGLGLSILKNSLEVHGGTVSFTSKEDGGSTFIVTIPVVNV